MVTVVKVGLVEGPWPRSQLEPAVHATVVVPPSVEVRLPAAVLVRSTLADRMLSTCSHTESITGVTVPAPTELAVIRASKGAVPMIAVPGKLATTTMDTEALGAKGPVSGMLSPVVSSRGVTPSALKKAKVVPTGKLLFAPVAAIATLKLSVTLPLLIT